MEGWNFSSGKLSEEFGGFVGNSEGELWGSRDVKVEVVEAGCGEHLGGVSSCLCF